MTEQQAPVSEDFVGGLVDSIDNLIVKRKQEILDPESLKREIVPIEEWIVSQYHVGDIAKDLYPFWREVVIEFIDGGYNELLLTGAVGTGKTFGASVVLIRKVYELSCYNSIPAFLDLASSTTLEFIYLSISIQQALKTGYGKIMRMIDAIPYFKELYPRNLKKESMLEFPLKHIIITQGSDVGHFTGSDLFAIIFDETNFRAGSDRLKLEKATEIYSSSVNRRKSRFLDNEADKSVGIICSSVDTITSFTESRIEEGMDDPTVLINRSTTWQTKPRKYSKNRFWMYKGSEKIDPFTEFDEAPLQSYFEFYKMLSCPIKDLPKKLLTDWVEVPLEYLGSFKTDPIRALADICGIASGGAHRLFTSKDKYYEAFPRDSIIQHPFTKQSVMISYRMPGRIEEYIREDWKGFSSDYTHYAHIDQSLTTDTTGICISHRERDKSNRRIAVIDLMLQVTPPPRPDQISIRKCREFLFWLVEKKGLHLGKLTYDQFASAEAIQEAYNWGIETDRQSVDKDSTQYDTLCDLILMGLIKGYHYPIFKNELFFLEKDRQRRKVDHAADRSKDVSDAVAGSVYLTMTEDDDLDDVTIYHLG